MPPPKPPVTHHQCPNGTDPGDVNKDGKKDAKDCAAKPYKPVAKPSVKSDKPIVNAGVEEATASPTYGGFGFNGTTVGIACVAALFLAPVVQVLRRQRVTFTRR